MIVSGQNLELLPDYHQRVEVLKQLNFIDSTEQIQLKGRVACEVILNKNIWNNILFKFIFYFLLFYYFTILLFFHFNF